MKKDISVMVLDDEPIVGERLQPVLQQGGFQVEVFTDSREALKRLEEKEFQVLVTDLKMSGPNGIDVLKYLKDHDRDTEAIVITGYATIESARAAEFLNAQFVTKPFVLKDIVKMVQKASKRFK